MARPTPAAAAISTMLAAENALFKRLGQLIARRPGRLALASGLTLVVLASGTAFYTASYEFDLPSGTESSAALDTLRSAFPLRQSRSRSQQRSAPASRSFRAR